MEPIIKVDNVSMCFNLSKEKHESLKEYFLAMVQGRPQHDEFYALKDVSLDIMPGDFYGLVGLNGSGKSTLLKTIAGVYKPSKGSQVHIKARAQLDERGDGAADRHLALAGLVHARPQPELHWKGLNAYQHCSSGFQL